MTLNEFGAGNGKPGVEMEQNDYISSKDGKLQNVVFKQLYCKIAVATIDLLHAIHTPYQ